MKKNKNVFYEVWVLGEDKNHCAVDFEQYLLENNAVTLEIAQIAFDHLSNKENLFEHFKECGIKLPKQVKYLRLVLEECVDFRTWTQCQKVIAETTISVN